MVILAPRPRPIVSIFILGAGHRIIHSLGMATRCIEPAKGPVDADFLAMPSKSATHRALVVAALAEGVSEIREPLDAGDTRRTLQGLRELGIGIDDRESVWVVHGGAGAVAGGATVDLGASGTSARFLTALATLGGRPSSLDGSPRLRERPMKDLLHALSVLGANVEASGGLGFPVRVGGGRVRGGAVVLSGARSSQFASALLLAAPSFQHGLHLEITPPRVSFSYVRMTVEMLEAFGGRVSTEEEARFVVPPQRLRATNVSIEGDHSSASYLFGAAAILGGRVRIRGLRADSAQPDARFLREIGALGCRVVHGDDGTVVEGSGRVPPFAWDLADAPDLAPTAAVLALFAEGPCVLSGLQHLTLKESDRLAVLQENLIRLGAQASVEAATLSITPPTRGELRGATIRVANDHRIAMAFAVAGLATSGVIIDDPGVVGKSYPRFWDDLAALARTGS
jgi:3-phosphoshikimate 1-carboxyvinyltransferase